MRPNQPENQSDQTQGSVAGALYMHVGTFCKMGQARSDHIIFTVYAYSRYGNVQIRSLSFRADVMANLNSSFTHPLAREYTTMSFLIRLGRREIFICRDFRKRYYNVHSILDFSTGSEPGYLEVLFLRRWLIILSKGQ